MHAKFRKGSSRMGFRWCYHQITGNGFSLFFMTSGKRLLARSYGLSPGEEAFQMRPCHLNRVFLCHSPKFNPTASEKDEQMISRNCWNPNSYSKIIGNWRAIWLWWSRINRVWWPWVFSMAKMWFSLIQDSRTTATIDCWIGLAMIFKHFAMNLHGHYGNQVSVGGF